ncbi:MAG: hypothetical protein M3125_02655, partial [Gemmatimonadota bacterium]|nr:hypothetical protein [Gemmatimonadota bacterium]
FGVVDRSDIDVYVFTVPNPSQGLNAAGVDTVHGSASSLNLNLPPGDYYLAVVDSAGVPTRYGLCIAMGITCTVPPAPPASLVATREASLLRPLAAYLPRPRRDARTFPRRP